MSTNETTQPSETIKPTFTVLLLRNERGNRPTKVGVTFPTGRGNQRIVWDVVPSAVELFHGTLVFVPYTERPEHNEPAGELAI